MSHRVCILGGVAKNQWMDKAACRGADSSIFMPSNRGPFDPVKKAEALSYCNRCPVRAECIDYALSFDITIGIYGGLTQQQRRALNKERRTV